VRQGRFTRISDFAPLIASWSDIFDALDVDGGIRVQFFSSSDALSLCIGHGTRPVGVGFGYVVSAIRALFDE